MAVVNFPPRQIGPFMSQVLTAWGVRTKTAPWCCSVTGQRRAHSVAECSRSGFKTCSAGSVAAWDRPEDRAASKVQRSPLRRAAERWRTAVPLAAPASPRGKTGPPARVLTKPASVGVCRTPVSRLFTRAGWPIAVRVLIAVAAKDRLRARFGPSRVSRGSEVATIETAACHRRPTRLRPAFPGRISVASACRGLQ